MTDSGEYRVPDLSAILDEINSGLTEGQAIPGTVQTASDVIGHTPTGLDILDAYLGGGWPWGRIIEIFGHESDGKTTLMSHGFVEVQKQGGYAVLIDEESTFDKARFVAQGGDLKRLIFLESNSFENSIAMVERTVTTIRTAGKRSPILIGYDTYAAASPSAEVEDEGEGIIAKARLSRRFFRRFSKDIARQRAVFLVLNQTIAEINKPGAGETTPGGRALKFHASIRLKVGRAGWIERPGANEDDNNKYMGVRVRFKIEKNKLGRPKQQFVSTLLFDTGFDNCYSALDMLAGSEDEYPIRMPKGSSWKTLVVGDTEYKFQSVNKFRKLYRTKPEVKKQLRKAAFNLFAPAWWKNAKRRVTKKRIEVDGKMVRCARLKCVDCPHYEDQEKVADAKVSQCPLVACKRALGLSVPDEDLRIYDAIVKGDGKGKRKKRPKKKRRG